MRMQVLLLTLLLPTSLPGQKNTWISAEAGLSTTRLQYANNTSKWGPSYTPGCMYGFYLRRELSPMFSLESGYGMLEYGDSYGLSKEFIVYDGGNKTHQVPLRVYADKEVFLDRIREVTIQYRSKEGEAGTTHNTTKHQYWFMAIHFSNREYWPWVWVSLWYLTCHGFPIIRCALSES
jgi:hypothetical protein